MSIILLLLALQTDVAVELAKINSRLAVIEAQLGIGSSGTSRLDIVGLTTSMADVRWTDIQGTVPLDWVGIYSPGTGNGAHRVWVYTSSCTTKVGSTTPVTGHCLLTIGTLAAGTYEARYFRNDAYTLVATSGSFIVTGSAPDPHAGHRHLFGPYSVEEVCRTAPDASYRLTLQWDAPETGANGYELLAGGQSIEVGNSLWFQYAFGQSGTQCLRVRAYFEG